MSEVFPEAVTSAQGVDVSRFQAPLDTAILHGQSFAFCKATEGLSSTDPEFARNWATIRSAGLHRGAYHEMTTDDAVGQAVHFAGTVAAAGLHDGDMLAIVASDYSPSGAQVRAALDHVRAAVGPRHPVLVYSDLSRLPSLAECAGYPLWIAHPGGAPASVAPWPDWRFWQWEFGRGADGGDRDAYNGTAAELDAWIASFTGPPAPPPPPVLPPAPAGLSASPITVRLSWEEVTDPSTGKPATRYRYQVAEGISSHPGLVIATDVVQATSVDAVVLRGTGPWTWRCQAGGNGRWSAWTAVG